MIKAWLLHLGYRSLMSEPTCPDVHRLQTVDFATCAYILGELHAHLGLQRRADCRTRTLLRPHGCTVCTVM